ESRTDNGAKLVPFQMSEGPDSRQIATGAELAERVEHLGGTHGDLRLAADQTRKAVDDVWPSDGLFTIRRDPKSDREHRVVRRTHAGDCRRRAGETRSVVDLERVVGGLRLR